jgi:hypothetical protein
MPFDVSTAKPVTDASQGGFDLSTAKPVGGVETVKNPVEDDSYSDDEYASPEDKKLSPDAARLERLARKAAKGKESVLKGAGESILSAATGLASTAVGGFAGLGRTAYSLASGEGVDKAAEKGAETVRDIQKAGTYQPRSATGQALNQAAGTVLSVPGKAGAAVGGAVGETVGGEQGRIAGEAIGEVAPALVPAAAGLRNVARAAVERPTVPKADSRGAKLLQKAMDELSPEELDQAKQLVKKSNEAGVPLTGPEAFKTAPKLHELLTNTDKSNNIISRFVKERPAQAKAAVEKKLGEVGENVGTQEAANAAQEAADVRITESQKFRTEVASPDYKAQRVSDEQALKLMSDIESTQKDVSAGTKWKNDAIQQAGRWYQFSHEMGGKANEVAAELKKWSVKDDELQNQVIAREARQNFENEGGREPKPVVVIPAKIGSEGSKLMQRVKAARGEESDSRGLAVKESDIDSYTGRAAEGKSATVDAVNEARRRQDFIDGWKKDIDIKADQLAEKNLPYVQGKISEFANGLKNELKFVGSKEEQSAAQGLIAELTPDGKPLTLPSQLESLYKSVRDRSEISIGSDSSARTAARFFKNTAGKLDNLIQEVSPSIKQGRQIYAEVSKEFVDPLMKGPVGRIAGKGADAQKEAVIGRVKAELEGSIATPDRIRTVFAELGKADPAAAPNVVRSWLEAKWNKAQKETIGTTSRLSGAKFAEGIASGPAERANVATMIEETAKSQGSDVKTARQAARGFNDLLEVLQSTGRIPKIGVQAAEESTLMERAIPAAMHSRAYGASKTAIEAIRDFIRRGSYENLAKVFTDPDAINKMVQLANTKKSAKEQRQQIVADVLQQAKPAAAGAALQPEEIK